MAQKTHPAVTPSDIFTFIRRRKKYHPSHCWSVRIMKHFGVGYFPHWQLSQSQHTVAIREADVYGIL